jgi:hypothetical protein
VTHPVFGDAPRFLTHPIEVIAEVVARVEPDLDPVVVHQTILDTARTRAQQRRLAAALDRDQDLLTSARPTGPKLVEQLIRALVAQGARHVVLPRCARCEQAKELPNTDGHGRRVCRSCFELASHVRAVCADCGQLRVVKYRDRGGRPRCWSCEPEPDIDHSSIICRHVLRVAPEFPPVQLRELVDTVVPQRSVRRNLAWELDARPSLLTGDGAHGSTRLIALIDALVEHGATRVTAPACPFCQRTVPLVGHRTDSPADHGVDPGRGPPRHAAVLPSLLPRSPWPTMPPMRSGEAGRDPHTRGGSALCSLPEPRNAQS